MSMTLPRKNVTPVAYVKKRASAYPMRSLKWTIWLDHESYWNAHESGWYKTRKEAQEALDELRKKLNF